MELLGSVAQATQTSQIDTYLTQMNLLDNPNEADNVHLKAAQKISENLDAIVLLPQYPLFLARLIKVIKPILITGRIQFISEFNVHQTRKVILEILYRLPTDDYLRPFVGEILQITLKLLEIDNEENGLICLQIMSEYRKKYKPDFDESVVTFLHLVKKMYNEFMTNFERKIQAKSSLTIRNIANLKVKSPLTETFITTTIHTNELDQDKNLVTYNLMPRVNSSLKFLQKVPAFLICLHTLYKSYISDEMAEIVNLIIQFITLNTDVIRNGNQEIRFEFVGVQVKSLMFISCNIREFIDIIFKNIVELFKGIVNLMRACPREATYFRKEIFIYFRYFIMTRFQQKFIPHIDQLLNEEYLFGPGYTTNEVLRPFVFNVIGDFIYDIRHQLSFSHLIKVVNFFSKVFHDTRLPATVENQSCKILSSLVECVKIRSEAEDYIKGRNVLRRIFEIFVLKLEIIVKDIIPLFSNTKTFATSQNLHQNMVEYKNIVKSIILGVQEIVIFNFSDIFLEEFQLNDTLILLRFLKWGLEALNIYMISRLAMNAMPKKSDKLIQLHETKLKEEKQVLESFATVFTSIDSLIFRKIFTSQIGFIINQVIKNKEFMAIINYFLLKPGKSFVFGTIMMEYLLERMDQVGSDLVISDLYVILFKTIFGSIAFSPEENEEILRSNLHKIIKRSLEFAVKAKEPLNYFIILRALSRSIGGGSNEILCQEFLPLLSKLIMDLNRYQSVAHRQEMQEILIEISLSIPIELCYHLPYLDKLMINIVHALNGNDYLIEEGLKTLDHCIEKIDFSFFRNYFEVATDLVQSLYRIVGESKDDLSQKAFEILGKIGGENRKVFTNQLQFIDPNVKYPAINLNFEELSINFSVKKIIDTAFSILDSDDLFYQQQSWRVINSYLSATIVDDDPEILKNLFTHSRFRGEVEARSLCYKENLAANDIQKTALSGLFIAAAKEIDSNQFETMLSYVRHYTMIFVTQQICSIPRDENLMNFANVRKNVEEIKQNPLVVIDALREILKCREREYFNAASRILDTILKTASTIVGSLERICEFPFMEYLFEKMISLCYESPWYAKIGGCRVIGFFIEKLPVKWLVIHLVDFIKGLFFVIADLSGEITNGTIDNAKANLEKLFRVCFQYGRENPENISGNEEVNDFQEKISKISKEVTRELVMQITSPCTLIRKEAMRLLCLLAEIKKVSMSEIIDPHREILRDVIPPIKHRIILHSLDIQIGIIDANDFCRRFNLNFCDLDPSVDQHQFFFKDLMHIIEKDDSQLAREPCYKDVSDFIPLKTTALRAITYFHSVIILQDSVRNILINTLKNPIFEIQETAFECLKKLPKIEKRFMRIIRQPLEKILDAQENVDLNFLRHILYLIDIFPLSHERFCNNLFLHLNKCVEKLKNENLDRKMKEDIDGKIKKQLDSKIKEELEKNVTNESEKLLIEESEKRMMEETKRRNANEKRKYLTFSNDILQQILTIIQILVKVPENLSIFIPKLCKYVLQSDNDFMNQILNQFHLPFARFLVKYPIETVDFLMNHNNIKNEEYGLFLEFILTIEERLPFQEIIKKRSIRLMQMFLAPTQFDLNLTKEEKMEIRFRAMKIVSILIDSDEKWLSDQNQLTTVIKQIWYRSEYIIYHEDIENVKSNHLSEPKVLLKVFIHYLKNNQDNFDFLFHVVKIFRINFVSDIKPLKDFIENIVVNYSVEWKRIVFSKFLGNFQGRKVSNDLKADILQYIVYKCFEASFKKGETEKLIGSPPSPDIDDPQNLISIFINKIINIDKPWDLGDRLKVAIFRFACLLIEYAAEYIHDASKSEGVKLRRLVSFAWPSLLNKSSVDPVTKYHGHLLLSHIISKISIAKSIVVHVFHCLMKAHAMETKNIVKEALDILIPVFPHRIENGYSKLAQLTRKVLIEESHSSQSLCHILQIVVKHSKVYYSVRHYLIPIFVNSIRALAEISTFESKKLAVDIVEMMIEWEIEAKNEETDIIDVEIEPTKRIQDENPKGFKRIVLQNNAPILVTIEPQMKRVENLYIDKILNSLFKFACEVNNINTLQGVMEEQVVKRSATVVKKIFMFDLWPQDGDVDLTWLDNILSTVNFKEIYKILEFLAFLLKGLKKRAIFYIFKRVQKGLSICVMRSDKKVLKLMQEILSELLSIFPIEPILTIVSGEAMKMLYETTRRVIRDRLTNFEKSDASQESLMACLMMSKVVYGKNLLYLDPIIMNLTKVFQKITKIHLERISSIREEIDLLIMSLEILTNRFGIMLSATRESFLTSLGDLIENTKSTKIIKIILQIMNKWAKDDSENQDTINKRSDLFVKMMRRIDKTDDLQLKENFLKIVSLIFQNTRYQKIERLISNLENAFLSGLRSTQPEIRGKFFSIFNSHVKRTIKDRLEYIIFTRNWKLMGSHYWIKQCIEFLLSVSEPTTRIKLTNGVNLPSFNDFMKLLKSQDVNLANLKELNVVLSKIESTADVLNLGLNISLPNLESVDLTNLESNLDLTNLESGDLPNLELSNLESNLELSNLESNMDLSNLESSADPFKLDISNLDLDADLLNSSTNLDIFNFDQQLDQSTNELNISNLINSKSSKDVHHQTNITNLEINTELNELITKEIEFLKSLKTIGTEEFVSAAIHLCHKDTNLAREVWRDIFPQLWNNMKNEERMLSKMNILPFICDKIHLLQKNKTSAIVTFCEALFDCKPLILMRPEIMKYLGKTFNMWHEITINLEEMIICQENEFQICQNSFGLDVNPCQEVFDSLSEMYCLLCEDDMWSGLWKKHAFFKETIDGFAFERQGLFEVAQENYFVALTKFTDFDVNGKSLKVQKEVNCCNKRVIHCVKELNQWNMDSNYKKQAFSDPFLNLEICLKTGDWFTMKECLNKEEESELNWKINLYRGYLAIYGEEKNLEIVNEYVSRASKSCINEWRKLPNIVSNVHVSILRGAEEIIDLNDAKLIHQNLAQENVQFDNLQKITKNWKRRLPTIGDDLSHWANIFTWREYQYKSVIASADLHSMENISKYYIHTWAKSVNTFSKIARKQNLCSLSLDSLKRIHELESVPVADYFERIKQQVKCYLKMASMGKMNLENALNYIESTEINYFKQEIISNFYSLKGQLFTLLGKSDEANETFSSSIQMHEKNSKAWGHWGEYLEKFFANDTSKIEYAVSAVTCYLNASKHSYGDKPRKYVAKILWLFNYDDEEMKLFKKVNKHAMEIFPIHWVTWIPQLLKWLTRPPGGEILNLLNVISRMFPQAMYSHIRTLYVKLRFQNLKILKKKDVLPDNDNEEKKQADNQVSELKFRCTKIMKILRTIHPTLISQFETIFYQITKLHEYWLQEILKSLRQILIMCYRVAFENKENISEAKVTLQIFHFIKKLVATVRHEVQNISNQSAKENPIFHRMNTEFAQDFSFGDKKSKLILNLIKLLKKWIAILENKTKFLLRNFLLGEKCRLLTNGNLEAAKIGLPGSITSSKFSNYPVTIVKFMPWVKVINYKCSIAHRLEILGSDGKLYPYLVATNDHFVDESRDYRVLQLLQLLNLNLKKQKETSRRFLQFTVPKMVQFHPQIQLIEDNPNAITFMEIYKQSCDKKGILHDAAISNYYQLLINVEARGNGLNNLNLKSIFNEVRKTHVSKTILKDWAVATFKNLTDYWTFRKMFITQISLAFFAQYVFHLTKLNPEMMSLHLDTGIMNVAYFTFDLNKISTDEPVPFRLTPNIAEFVTDIGISGPMTENLIAIARSLIQPSYHINSILQAIIRDEIGDNHIKQSLGNMEKNKEIVKRVTEFVTSITTRLNSVGNFNGIDSTVRTLLNNARNVDNLCQMDPTWYPWL